MQYSLLCHEMLCHVFEGRNRCHSSITLTFSIPVGIRIAIHQHFEHVFYWAHVNKIEDVSLHAANSNDFPCTCVQVTSFMACALWRSNKSCACFIGYNVFLHEIRNRTKWGWYLFIINWLISVLNPQKWRYSGIQLGREAIIWRFTCTGALADPAVALFHGGILY